MQKSEDTKPDVNAPYYVFKSSCCDLYAECFLGMVNHFCASPKKLLLGVNLLVSLATWMVELPAIKDYVRKMPHPTLRFPTFMQAFIPQAEEMKEVA